MNRVALVTGAAKRIGRAIALRLAKEGYAIAIHCRRSRTEALELKAIIQEAGGRAAVVQADLADTVAVSRLVAEAAAALGPLTLLVNNASVFEPDEVKNLATDLWDRHFAANLRAPVFLTRDFARQLPGDQHGAVVNIVDQRVWRLNPSFLSYTLSKAALFTATQTLAQSLAPRIRVNAVGPGPTLTSSRQSEQDFARQGEALPLRRHPTPDDMAVDGGQHLAWETPDVAAVKE
jgi:NAD(P)-dependent dehydrogenase (short-subunit alcohol dehydrogenase family)